MRPGQMRQKITFNTITGTTDSQGGESETETAGKTCWASVKPMIGYRALEYGKIVSGKPYEIYTNWPISNITINEKRTITYGTKKLTIHSVINPDENRKSYKIIAYEEV